MFNRVPLQYIFRRTHFVYFGCCSNWHFLILKVVIIPFPVKRRRRQCLKLMRLWRYNFCAKFPKKVNTDWHGVFNGVLYKETLDPFTDASNVCILCNLILVFFSEITGPEQCLWCFSWLDLHHRKTSPKGQNRMCPYIHGNK